MKRISILLAVCLLLSIPAQAAAPAVFQYQSSQLGFSITVPGICQGEVIAEETDTGVNFYHAPSREKYGGEIGSVVVVSPRSDFFSGHYDDMAYQIIAMGKNRVFLWKVPGGGAPTDALPIFPPAEIFWMPFDGYPPPFPWRICGRAWFRLSRMDGRSSKQRGIWPTCP